MHTRRSTGEDARWTLGKSDEVQVAINAYTGATDAASPVTGARTGDGLSGARPQIGRDFEANEQAQGTEPRLARLYKKSAARALLTLPLGMDRAGGRADSTMTKRSPGVAACGVLSILSAALP